jgi:hypothetical protein
LCGNYLLFYASTWRLNYESPRTGCCEETKLAFEVCWNLSGEFASCIQESNVTIRHCNTIRDRVISAILKNDALNYGLCCEIDSIK